MSETLLKPILKLQHVLLCVQATRIIYNASLNRSTLSPVLLQRRRFVIKKYFSI